MLDLICVEFTKSNPPWHPGQLAGFEIDTAFALVRGGKAKFVDPPPGLDEFGIKIVEREVPDPKPMRKPRAKAKAKRKPKVSG